MDESVRAYLAQIGAKGGRRSRRTLAPSDAKSMVLVREARRAYREFQAECFWSYDPDYEIKLADVPWVVEQLQKHGGRRAWEKAAQLCR
jgi:hypothetical protein